MSNAMTSKESPMPQNTMRTPARRPGFGPMGGHGMRHPGDKAKDFKGTVRKLLSYIAKDKLRIVLVLFFALCSTLFIIAGPKVMSQATTELFNGFIAKVQGTGSIDFTAIAGILIATVVLYGFAAASSFIQGLLITSVAQRTSHRMRMDIENKIERMPMGYFERTSTGDVLSRITNDVDTLGQSFAQGLVQLVTSIVTVVGIIIMMLTISPILTLIAILVVPISGVFMRIVIKHSQKYYQAQQTLLGAINSQVEETFSGHALVRAYAQERRVTTSFNETNDELYQSAWKSQFLTGLMMPIMMFISNLGYVGVAIAGSFLAVQGVITVGDIQAFIQYVKNLTQPITQLSQVANVLQQMAASAERIFEFLDTEEIPHENLPALTDVKGEVVFDHVKFGYVPDTPVIKDFSARVKPGQMVAIVGPTGAGKTTLVKLLMRFYDVDAGTISIDGKNIQELSRESVRDAFAMVLQDTWLFSGTIKDNIRYGNMDATDEEIDQAAKAAFAHHFIETQPGGYDMVINEDASNLSLGQRQLITIARAFLSDRPMLILDEATSSVDTRTERSIQKAMERLMEGRTSFVIAHRLSTIRSADLILCLDGGDVVEMGTHDELIARNGFYANLYQAQFREVTKVSA